MSEDLQYNVKFRTELNKMFQKLLAPKEKKVN